MQAHMDGPVPTNLIRELPTPELALELLRRLAASSDLNANNTLREAQGAFQYDGEPDVQFLLERLSDAWAWLDAHALIGPHTSNTASVWVRLTREGRRVAAEANPMPSLWARERLAGDMAAQLERRVRPIFNLGDHETAAFAAMKEVEVEVRRLARLDESVLGVDLMRQAFRPQGGPLADPSAHRGEQVALMDFFSGAIGTFKNPSSHRTVHFADPVEAAEVVQVADLLLRLLRRVEERLSSEPPRDISATATATSTSTSTRERERRVQR